MNYCILLVMKIFRTMYNLHKLKAFLANKALVA